MRTKTVSVFTIFILCVLSFIVFAQEENSAINIDLTAAQKTAEEYLESVKTKNYDVIIHMSYRGPNYDPSDLEEKKGVNSLLE